MLNSCDAATAAAAADDDDDDGGLLAMIDTAGITCLVAFDVVTDMLPDPRVNVVRITEDWILDLADPDVIKGCTTGRRDVPERLITTGPEVDVRMTASPGLPDRPLFSLSPTHT